MVKGVAKQAVILQPWEKSGFEQAIFILAPDSGGCRVGSAEELLAAADSIVSEYTIPCIGTVRKRRVLPCLISFVTGAALAAAILLLGPYFGL